MTDQTADAGEVAPKSSKLPMIIGVVLALLGGAGGFVAVQSGLLGGQETSESHDVEEKKDKHAAPLPDVTFVEVPVFVVSMGPASAAQHLRFRASLEVPSEHASDVTKILPRVQDVMNSYLRALEPADIEAQGALIRMRAQMLRRVKLVIGEERVKDLLVLEFVLT